MDKRPFVIDCDTGTDDAIAIVAALYSDEVEVKAITSVNGNVREEYVCRNNLNLTAYLGKSIPVAKGAVRPLVNDFIHKDDGTHGVTGLGNVILPEANTCFDPRIASELLYETAAAEHGELELLVIGPMTNIAITLLQHSDFAGLIKHMWVMGGAAIGGNVNTTAEFNIWVDPEAAHLVFQSGIPITMVGLDVTTRAIMKEEDAAEIRTAGTKAAGFVADLLDYMFDRRDKGGEDAMMHDALAFAAAMRPRFLKTEHYFVDVEYGSRYTSGHTMVDMRRKTGREPNAEVALGIDVPAFRKWMVQAVKNSAKCGEA